MASVLHNVARARGTSLI
ncbi:hypothetical protein CGLO_01194 [Colletotrichum gloeosporioides Cg-14]|uniref:Uncharacterized protein n=1 Tax=Colletotrichum gloeosporioides (strain Cg-14) TaxID=1237896 RepID=T0M4U0_COLGC|nr:hypothetical protein CGLO_01194 [Colletotrichum gloeosporioides Cg-14]